MAAQSIATLEALHNAARTIADVSGAIRCQPQCDTYAGGEESENVVGAFANWINDAAGRVMEAAVAEARTRTVSPVDVGTRLLILSEAAVADTDPVLIRSLAHDLNAHALDIEVQRGRRG